MVVDEASRVVGDDRRGRRTASNIPSDSDDSIKWEDFYGPPVDISSSLLDMYDTLVAQSKDGDASSQLKRSNTHPTPTSLRLRPLSCSSSSSSSSSSSLHPRNDAKKCYLASIESLDQDDEEASPRALQRAVAGSAATHSLAENAASRFSYVDRVILEIVDTERTYVADLDAIVQGYLKPLSQEANDRISPDDLSHLFGNIRDIFSFNSTFLEQLERCGSDPVELARCFVVNSGGFSVYTEFCTNYPRTVSVLTKLVGRAETAQIFKARQLTLHHSLPLGSYLLKPVQRILKYHLLLQNIVKNFDKDAEGYPDMKNALSVMTGIACHINNMKRKHEHAVRVQEIQSLLYGWQGKDLTTYGELVAEGSFRMLGAKALRHLFLFEKVLLIAKKREEGILDHKTHIMCSNLMLIESIQGEPLYFQVVPFDSPCNQYSFQARNVEQKREWCLQLKRVIIESFSTAIPSHAKQLVLELGQSKMEEDLSQEKGSVKKSLSAPEYLKRRKHDRRKSETSIHKAFGLRRGLKKAFSQDMCTCICHMNVAVPPSLGGSGDSASNFQPSGSCNRCSASCRQRRCARDDAPSPIVSAPSTPLPKASSETSPQGPRWDLVDTSDTENEDNSAANVQRLLRYRKTSSVQSAAEDSSGEYVTFEFASGHATRNGSNRVDANYDDLMNLWTRLGTVPHAEQSAVYSSEPSRTAPVRRSQSFTEMAKSKAASFVTKRSVRELRGATVPWVWLDQQLEHLPPTACAKCGSLPRSFQPGESGVTKMQQLRERAESMRTQHMDQRPFTIASDKPSRVDFADDGGRYFNGRPLERNGSEEVEMTTSCTTTPAASLEDVADIHPNHKIYHWGGIRHGSSWRSVLSGFGSKLSNLRSSRSLSHDDSPHPPQSRPSVSGSESRVSNSKLATSLGKAYANVVRPRRSTPAVSPRVRRGSSAVAARMARPRDSDYCLPKTILALLSKEGVDTRPDSVLSESSNRTSSSSSDGDKSEQTRGTETPDCGDESDGSDASADSYYERTFEEIENVLVEEMFRDSAIYSEPEDVDVVETLDDHENPETNSPSALTWLCVRKVKGTIFEKLKVLEEKTRSKGDEPPKPSVEGLKSIEQRRKELEEWCKAPLSAKDTDRIDDTEGTESLLADDGLEELRPCTKKGWVKHVVDRFQTGVADGGT